MTNKLLVSGSINLKKLHQIICLATLSSCGVVIVVLGSSVVDCIDELFDLPQDVRVMEIIVKRILVISSY